MSALFFILLLVTFIAIFKKRYQTSLKLYGLFVVLWIAFFIPHLIRTINIQL
jgi:hypothetical protein